MWAWVGGNEGRKCSKDPWGWEGNSAFVGAERGNASTGAGREGSFNGAGREGVVAWEGGWVYKPSHTKKPAPNMATHPHSSAQRSLKKRYLDFIFFYIFQIGVKNYTRKRLVLTYVPLEVISLCSLHYINAIFT